MNTRPHKNVLASLREHPLRWSIVRDGMQWTTIGLLVTAGGFILSIVGFAVRDWSGVFAATLAVMGGLALLTGSLLAIIGFVQCLLVPNAAPRILFLSGFLVSGYSVYLLMSRMFYSFGRRSNFSDLEEVLGSSPMAQMPTTILSLLANLLIVAGFLALAADIGSRKTVKRIRIYWIVQFGGFLLMVGLAVLAEPIASAFNKKYVGFLWPLLVGFFVLIYTLLLLFMQASILRTVHTELLDLTYQAREKLEADDDEDEWISV